MKFTVISKGDYVQVGYESQVYVVVQVLREWVKVMVPGNHNSSKLVSRDKIKRISSIA